MQPSIRPFCRYRSAAGCRFFFRCGELMPASQKKKEFRLNFFTIFFRIVNRPLD